MPSDPLMRLFIGETPETLRSALDALDTIEPADAGHDERLSGLRRELTTELDRSKAEQGSLF